MCFQRSFARPQNPFSNASQLVRRAYEKVFALNSLLQSPFQALAEDFFDHLLKAFVPVNVYCPQWLRLPVWEIGHTDRPGLCCGWRRIVCWVWSWSCGGGRWRRGYCISYHRIWKVSKSSAILSVVILNFSDESSVEPSVRNCSRYYCGDDGILQFLGVFYKVISWRGVFVWNTKLCFKNHESR
jgi:hypothetical protein